MQLYNSTDKLCLLCEFEESSNADSSGNVDANGKSKTQQTKSGLRDQKKPKRVQLTGALCATYNCR